MHKYLAHHIITLLCAVLALCVCMGCHRSKQDDRPVLTVSIEPLRYVVEAVAGNKYRVAVLMPQGASPETYEPTPRQMMELNRSELLFRVGTLGFEQTRLPQMMQTTPQTRMVDLAQGITPIIDAHHHHEDGPESSMDPHVWMSTQNLCVMAKNTCTALCQTDSANAPYYQQRLSAFLKQMDSLDVQLRGVLQQLPSRAFLIYHPALGYMARQYGLKQLAVEHDGKEPSAAYMQQLINMCRAEEVHTVFISKEHSGKAAQRIAQEIGARLVSINPLDYDVPTQMLQIAKQMKDSGK